MGVRGLVERVLEPAGVDLRLNAWVVEKVVDRGVQTDLRVSVEGRGRRQSWRKEQAGDWAED